MSDSNPIQPEPPRPPAPFWQPRFGVGSLLLVTFVFSVMGSAGYYLLRALQGGGREAQLGFILFTLAAPLLLVVLASFARALYQWLQRAR